MGKAPAAWRHPAKDVGIHLIWGVVNHGYLAEVKAATLVNNGELTAFSCSFKYIWGLMGQKWVTVR